ncbi:nitroreductase [Mesosutterella sp. AGMB02718]|uniref:Nitroreductase n=1 Tax=Mesosutterella faecium TaxID=2925194 RepID=A0ABT7IPA4_9BURK|nr:nitroreductase [Mesosutterella sp. AGMB02718]MDL2060220.1 nitroreductase [Mesosutterella sp. AGMB02718]
MEFSELVKARHSVRLFRPDPVPAEVLRSIVRDAQRAPSTVNAQDWRVWIAVGGALEAIRSEYQARTSRNEPRRPDFPPTSGAGWSAAARARQKAFSASRTAAGLNAVKMASQAQLFHAPAVAYITIPDPANLWAVLDAGGFEAMFLLSAANHGLGAVPAYNLVTWPGPVKSVLGIPESEKLAIGIALGYEEDCPLNRFRSSRAPLEDFLVIRDEAA